MRPARKEWPDAHSQELKRLIEDGKSYADAAAYINRKYHTVYTRSGCIGRLRRMTNNKSPRPRVFASGTREERTRAWAKRSTEKRREKRWAANPSLAVRAQRIKERKETRAKMLASNTPKTAAAYRMHLPRLPTMTRAELRAMLTEAVQNTKAMETA